jgi:hypothetical protein
MASMVRERARSGQLPQKPEIHPKMEPTLIASPMEAKATTKGAQPPAKTRLNTSRCR